jgi:hypothetical protein
LEALQRSNQDVNRQEWEDKLKKLEDVRRGLNDENLAIQGDADKAMA